MSFVQSFEKPLICMIDGLFPSVEKKKKPRVKRKKLFSCLFSKPSCEKKTCSAPRKKNHCEEHAVRSSRLSCFQNLLHQYACCVFSLSSEKDCRTVPDGFSCLEKLSCFKMYGLCWAFERSAHLRHVLLALFENGGRLIWMVFSGF